jgi:hypothetical protein
MSKRKTPPAGSLVRAKATAPTSAADLFADVRHLIEQGRSATSQAVNSALVMLYWSIGDRIRREILQEKRAEYGEQIVQTIVDPENWTTD